MSTIAFIPVRGGSKSIPGKNIKNLGGKPLLHWTLEAACSAQGIDEVWVSSDSPEILRVAEEFDNSKVHITLRSEEFATDTASTESAMINFAEEHDFDVMVLIQATSPLTTARDLDGGLRQFNETQADSLLSGTHEHRFLWERTPGGLVQPKNYQPAKRPRRQDWSGEWLENGAFYICRRDGLLESQCRLHGKIAYWTMPVRSAFEIDTPDDWHVLESLAHQVRGEKLAKLEVAEPQLLISDVDGVLTDGGMYYGPEGEALKKFSTRDGMGFKRWREAGKTVAIVTGENSPSVAARAAKLQVTDLHLGIQDKLPVVQAIAKKHGLRLNQIAYIGDDINDEEAMRAVGWSACPQDAEPAIQEIAHYRCQRRGGEGCVREFIDRLLSGKN